MHTTVPTALRALLGVIAALATFLLTSPAASAADNPRKVYVVKTAEENGGQSEILFDIAERTLGDGNRFKEIFALNAGRRQPDGLRMESSEVVVPGWILILPDDASGPDVQVVRARPPAPDGAIVPGPAGGSAPLAAPPGGTGPSPLAVGLITGAVAIVAAGTFVLARRGRAAVASGPASTPSTRRGRSDSAPASLTRPRKATSVFASTSPPGTRPQRTAGGWFAGRRSARRRAALGKQLAADTRTTLVARLALRELVEGRDPVQVYTVLSGPDGLTATTSGSPRERTAHWIAKSTSEWECVQPPSTGAALANRVDSSPHLVRVGTVGDAQLLVDLDRVEGILSVDGDLHVARDTVKGLARGLLDAPKAQTSVVLVDPLGEEMRGHHGVRRIQSPAQLLGERPSPQFDPRMTQMFVVGGRVPETFAGFVVVLHPVGASDAEALAELAAPSVGWTVLTVGDAPGAHWRWYAAADGTVDTGVLGLTAVVPAM